MRFDSEGKLLVSGISGSGGGGSGAVSFLKPSLIAETSLTAPGSTPVRQMENYTQFSYQIKVSNIGTNIKVRIEGNLIGEEFSTLHESGQDITITTNGCHLFLFNRLVNQVRFSLVSISGGSPIVAVYLQRGY